VNTKRLFIGGSLALAMGLCACGGGSGTGPSGAKGSAKAQEIAAAVPEPYNTLLGAPRRDANDAARFLAGMPGPQGSPFQALESEAAWKAHAERISSIWDKAEQSRISKIRSFDKTALSGPVFEGKTVFYPFSGPDVLTALSFFPNHKVYVLAALEPPGTLPEPGEFSADALARQLTGLDSTLASLLGRSFFITREMDKQLRGQITDGVFPVMLVQLARMNHTVTRWAPVKLDDQGKLVERSGAEPRAAFGRNRAVLLEFKDEGSSEPHLLLYVSLNLDDKHMAENQAFKAFAGSLSPTDSMLKSTSYMMHRKNFSQIRELILNVSASIVQDDSGVPFGDFDPAKWEVHLYGTYDKPYSPFEYMQQKDLRDAYQGDSVKPLDFRIGYGAGKIPSNLQVAIKK
jgi:hypothetical protein